MFQQLRMNYLPSIIRNRINGSMQTSETLIHKKRVVLDNMKYIPSPINFSCNQIFSAVVNRSGRMQYYRSVPGKNKERISRTEFCMAYNTSIILGIKPLQTDPGTAIFQMIFYV